MSGSRKPCGDPEHQVDIRHLLGSRAEARSARSAAARVARRSVCDGWRLAGRRLAALGAAGEARSGKSAPGRGVRRADSCCSAHRARVQTADIRLHYHLQIVHKLYLTCRSSAAVRIWQEFEQRIFGSIIICRSAISSKMSISLNSGSLAASPFARIRRAGLDAQVAENVGLLGVELAQQWNP